MDISIKIADVLLALILFGFISAIALNIIWNFDQERKQQDNRRKLLKLQAIKNGEQFEQKHRILKKKLRKYSLSFPRRAIVKNINTLNFIGYESYVFDYSYTRNKQSTVHLSGILINFEAETFPQFCVTKYHPFSTSFLGGDSIPSNLLPEWANTLTIKTTETKRSQVCQFVEKEERILDIVSQPFFSQLFVDKKFVLLYLSKPIPANEYYFDIARDRLIKIIEVFGGRISAEHHIKTLKQANKI